LYDSDPRNYDITPPIRRSKWTDEEIASMNLTTYDLSIIYTPVAGVPAPVTITLFASLFNNGTFLPNGDLQFTNVGGDLATIIGLDAPFRSIQDNVTTEPFNIAFIKMEPQTIGQFRRPFSMINGSVFVGGIIDNKITPKTFFDPYQTQSLITQVPMNYMVNQKRGWSFDVDINQTGDGIGMTLFVGTILEPSKAIYNKPIVRQMGKRTF